MRVCNFFINIMKYLYILIFTILSVTAVAQQQVKKGTLSGVVADSETGELLQTAAVQLLALPDTVY